MTNHIHIYVGGKTRDGVKEDAKAIDALLQEMAGQISKLRDQMQTGNISQSAKSLARTLKMNAETVLRDLELILK